MPKETKSKTGPISLRLTAALEKQLEEACHILGASQADILRESIAIGLKWLKKNDYNQHQSIISTAEHEQLVRDMAQALRHTFAPASYQDLNADPEEKLFVSPKKTTPPPTGTDS